eukprot:TRINITY_DN10193_c0_g1_i1.p1 TRINITY_DN10193_c0_g1~~TRINITY_DN10193_c0_g1_i1.p1  ORF type:complete len:671 (-),score=128.82 TRINITY_DN10193_c0_g1_i1:8-2020(-)
MAHKCALAPWLILQLGPQNLIIASQIADSERGLGAAAAHVTRAAAGFDRFRKELQSAPAVEMDNLLRSISQQDELLLRGRGHAAGELQSRFRRLQQSCVELAASLRNRNCNHTNCKPQIIGNESGAQKALEASVPSNLAEEGVLSARVNAMGDGGDAVDKLNELESEEQIEGSEPADSVDVLNTIETMDDNILSSRGHATGVSLDAAVAGQESMTHETGATDASGASVTEELLPAKGNLTEGPVDRNISVVTDPEADLLADSENISEIAAITNGDLVPERGSGDLASDDTDNRRSMAESNATNTSTGQGKGKGASHAKMSNASENVTGVCHTPTDTSKEHYDVTEVSLERATFEVKAKCRSGFVGMGAAMVCDDHLMPYKLSGCNADPPVETSILADDVSLLGAMPKMVCTASALEALATDLEAHLQLLRSKAILKKPPPSAASLAASKALSDLQLPAKHVFDSRATMTARRLGAKLAQLQASGGDDAAFREIQEEAKTAISMVVQLARGDESSSDTKRSLSGASRCTIAGVAFAGRRFDKVARGFTKEVLRQMLPPEADNLHRIVHTLEVLQSSLSRQLESLADMADEELLKECGRFFSGVHQLEADLAHYTGQEKTTTQPRDVRPVSQPLQEGQLPPLELAAPGVSSSKPLRAVAATGMPVLNAASFR